MARSRRRITLAVGDSRIPFTLREARWLLKRLRAVDEGGPDAFNPAIAIAAMLEAELENCNPHPVQLGPGEVDLLYAMVKVYAAGYPRWDGLLDLEQALREDRQARGLES